MVRKEKNKMFTYYGQLDILWTVGLLTVSIVQYECIYIMLFIYLCFRQINKCFIAPLENVIYKCNI